MGSKKRPLTQTTLENHSIIAKKKQKSFHSQVASADNDGKLAGTVKKMVLKNFMCHSYLEVNIQKNINYVIGKNGSGKSAILSALVVGLAGKASATNRGTSTKTFIKAGQNSGSVEITLNNSGLEAYKPAIFGDEIIIQRSFTMSGSSSYRVKTSTGQLVSSSAKEIYNILGYLNIQVDNPVCILNQDTSRNFLSTDDTKQKFALYMRATGLEALHEEKQKLHSSLKDLQGIYTEKLQLYKKLQNEMKVLKAKVQSHRTIEELQEKFNNITAEILWATVAEYEQKSIQQQRIVDDLQKKFDKYQHNSKNRVQKEEEIKTKVTELDQQIQEIKQMHTAQGLPLKDIDMQLRRFKENMLSKKTERQLTAKGIVDSQRNIEALQKEIQNFTDNLSKMEKEKLERAKAIAAVQEKLKALQDTEETTQNEMFQLRGSIMKVEQEEQNLFKEKQQLKTQYDNTKDDIANLKMESNNSLHLYGRDMPQVVEAIKANQHRFRKMPRGPLGAYVSIRDKNWAVAVEGFLGPGMLQAFTVDNIDDNRVLIEILNRYWRSGNKPTIITTRFSERVHDVMSNLVQAPNDCISLFDAIEVKDPVVMNCLIDQNGIENILLIPSSERAMELLSERARVPRNCKQGVTVKGDRFYPDPNYRTYGSRYKQARYLQVDKADLISHNEEKVRQIHAKIVSVEKQLGSVNVDKKNQRTQLQDVIMRKEQLKQKCLTLKRQLDDLRMTEEPEAADYQSLENELTVLKNSINEKSVKVEHLEEEIKGAKDAMSVLEERKREILGNIQCLEDRINPLEAEIIRLVQERNELNINSKFEKKRIQDTKDQLDASTEKLERIQGQVVQQINLGGGEDNRIVTNKSSRDLQEEATKANEKIQELIQIAGDIEEITAKYKTVVDKHEQSGRIIMSIEQSMDDLSTAEKKRSRHYRNAKDYFTQFVDHNFGKILNFRQFKGNININYHKKTLELVVIPQQGSQGHTATTNLSGGERSFSTVAFLYSLWQVLHFPFYFLDEFDVFMDKINRCKIMEILIYHAKQRSDVQFVFLTPQDISFIQDKEIAIHRLEDPERRQVNEA